MRDAMLMVHFLGVAMFLGTGLGFMFLEIANSRREKSEALQFTKGTFALSKMGHIGLLLVWVSGLYLMRPYWGLMSNLPLLLAKLILVGIVTVLLALMAWHSKKALQGNFEKHLKKIEVLGNISLLSGLAIVVLAVLVFH